MTSRDETAPQHFSTLFGWAVYLACSWTWCIGMYLPVVLRDHYGFSAVLAFAIPNVVGVMLFAVGVGTVARSRALIAGHTSAMLWFSLTAIAFHVYFLGAVWGYEFPGFWWPAAMLVPLPIVALAWLARTLSDRMLLRLAGAVYWLSMCLVMLASSMKVGPEAHVREAVWAGRAPSGVVFLVPVFIIGFLSCPYLDLTFHRALAAVGGRRPGKTTFALFGATFAVMLVVTAIYSQTGLVWPVIMHILVQSWFTITVHFKEIETRRCTATGDAVGRWVWPVLVISWLLAPLPLIDYRWWFILTGLIFPAYVALMMVRPRLGRKAAHQMALAALIVLLMPFSALGFLNGGWEWLTLIPSVTLVLSLGTGTPGPAAGRPPLEAVPVTAPSPAG